MTGSKLQWKEIQFLKRENVEIVRDIKILKYYCHGSTFDLAYHELELRLALVV